MPGNALLTITMITREALRVLHNNLAFTKGVNREYSDEFAKSGAKIGQTVNVRLPNKYYVRDAQAMSVQPTSETYVPLTLSHQWGTDVSFSSKDLTLSLDDFSKRILTPAVARIASKIDYTGLAEVLNVYNQVGTPGTSPGSSTGGTGLLCYTTPTIFLNAGAQMDWEACPRDENRHVILSPTMQATSIQGLSGLINNQELVGEQYRKGAMGTALGFNFAMDQNVNSLTVGTRASVGGVGTTSTDNTAIIYNSTATGTLKAGEVFTVSGCYAVNPETGVSTGQLRYFTCTADITLTGTNDAITVSPKIIKAGTTVPNATVDAVPTAGAVITYLSGTASTAYPLGVAFHRDAFTMATADLELPQGVDFAARETYDGISMRIVRAYDIVNDMFPCRIDVLGGWATLRPELACRIVG